MRRLTVAFLVVGFLVACGDPSTSGSSGPPPLSDAEQDRWPTGGSATGGGAGSTWGGAAGGAGFNAGQPGGLGVVAGGAQDFSLIRALVDAGRVPQADDFVTEGLFAEHDLPLAAPPCTRLLCLGVAEATTPGADGGLEHWVQLGMASGLSEATFVRPRLDVAAVLDRSCSMEGGRFSAAKDALSALVDKLGPDDTFALVQFDGTAQVVSPPVAVSDRAALKHLIGGLVVGGATCIECGLDLGYGLLAQLPPSSARERRVILMTDAQPNVGGTRPTDFVPLLEANAQAGRHLTAMGVGLDFGQALVSKLAATRGANFVFLADTQRLRTVFDLDFDFLVTPLAFDLETSFVVDPALAMTAMYGVPGVDPSSGQLTSKVATLFLSRSSSGGALLARLTGPTPASGSLAHLMLRYETTDLGVVTQQLDALAPAGLPPVFAEPGVEKTVALARFVDLAKEACRAHHAGDDVTARARADEAVAGLTQARASTGDPALDQEVQLAVALRALFGP